MSILNLKNMTTAEKIMAMEELWEDMDKTVAEVNRYTTPDWHFDILDEREKKVQSGEASFSDFKDVKKRLQARLDNK